MLSDDADKDAADLARLYLQKGGAALVSGVVSEDALASGRLSAAGCRSPSRLDHLLLTRQKRRASRNTPHT